MIDSRRARGLLDTSVVIDLKDLPLGRLPVESSIAAITLAELTAGPLAAPDVAERARRQEVLQLAESMFEVLPFDALAARAFGRLYAVMLRTGRKTRGRRSMDVLIAATALANGLPLYTRNPDDFEGLDELIDILAV